MVVRVGIIGFRNNAYRLYTLIQNHTNNEEWISIVEEKIANLSFTLLETRKKVLLLINNELNKIAESFSSCNVEFIYDFEIGNYT